MSYREKKNNSDGEFSGGLALDLETIRRYRSKGIPLHPKQEAVLKEHEFDGLYPAA